MLLRQQPRREEMEAGWGKGEPSPSWPAACLSRHRPAQSPCIERGLCLPAPSLAGNAVTLGRGWFLKRTLSSLGGRASAEAMGPLKLGRSSEEASCCVGRG